jgi:hypothetical protein
MIIIVSKSGQLGNRLFQFAHFIAFSEQCGVTVWNPGFEDYAKGFEGTGHSAVCRYPVKAGSGVPVSLRPTIYGIVYKAALFAQKRNLQALRLRTRFLDWDEECRLDDPAFESSLRKMEILFAHGYEFRARSYFNRHADAIRRYFSPTREHQLKVDGAVAAARINADVVVGIHIRRGDYKEFMDGRYYYEIPDYLELMKSIEKLFPGKRVSFLVCSNERFDPALFSSFQTTFGPGHPVEDLYSFARCDYLAGPPSSFTLWAAFYGGCSFYQMREKSGSPRGLEDFTKHSEEKRLVF